MRVACDLRVVQPVMLDREGIGMRVVDIPMRQLLGKDDEGRCRYPGMACARQAVEGEWCREHRMWDGTIAAALGVPFPDDRESLKLLLAMTLNYVVSGKLRGAAGRNAVELCRMIQKAVHGS